uniref:Uncharacterized protein n=1 Tax=Arundo donax TaxID=35708 RepID=A0A0A9CKY2_ARUDO
MVTYPGATQKQNITESHKNAANLVTLLKNHILQGIV